MVALNLLNHHISVKVLIEFFNCILLFRHNILIFSGNFNVYFLLFEILRVINFSILEIVFDYNLCLCCQSLSIKRYVGFIKFR